MMQKVAAVGVVVAFIIAAMALATMPAYAQENENNSAWADVLPLIPVHQHEEQTLSNPFPEGTPDPDADANLSQVCLATNEASQVAVMTICLMKAINITDSVAGPAYYRTNQEVIGGNLIAYYSNYNSTENEGIVLGINLSKLDPERTYRVSKLDMYWIRREAEHFG